MKSRIYFPGLDALRFFAALFVVINHTDQFKALFGIIESYEAGMTLSRFIMSGHDAVVLFFVLSGFLITYLLLVEIERTDNVSIRDFYIRRTLRIWPLYYFVMLIGFFLVPVVIKLTNFDGYYVSVSLNFWRKFLLYLFFLPNITLVLGYMPVGISHLWTIGVEEYFYLLWPQLIKRVRKNILPAIFGILIVRLGLITLFFFWFRQDVFRPGWLDFLILAANQFTFEAMAMGGLLAYVYYHQKERILRILYHPIMAYSLVILLALNMVVESTIFNHHIPFFGSFIVAGLYATLILNISTNPGFPLKLEHPAFSHLGKLSYGIYMYHVVVIYFVMIAFDMRGFRNDTLLFNVILHTVVIVITLIVSHYSYRYFEKPFLRLKERFAVVKSGHAISDKTQDTPVTIKG